MWINFLVEFCGQWIIEFASREIYTEKPPTENMLGIESLFRCGDSITRQMAPRFLVNSVNIWAPIVCIIEFDDESGTETYELS